MNDTEIKIGDAVMLKSGGPLAEDTRIWNDFGISHSSSPGYLRQTYDQVKELDDAGRSYAPQIITLLERHGDLEIAAANCIKHWMRNSIASDLEKTAMIRIAMGTVFDKRAKFDATDGVVSENGEDKSHNPYCAALYDWRGCCLAICSRAKFGATLRELDQ